MKRPTTIRILRATSTRNTRTQTMKMTRKPSRAVMMALDASAITKMETMEVPRAVYSNMKRKKRRKRKKKRRKRSFRKYAESTYLERSISLNANQRSFAPSGITIVSFLIF